MSVPRCAGCATELPPGAIACPACGALLHAERLRRLAAEAETSEAGGDLERARDAWQQALSLLPIRSAQFDLVNSRVGELTRRIAAAGNPPPTDRARSDKWWKGGAAGAVAAASLLLGKLKFLALGLMKAKTFFSMLAFFGVYWTTYGWPLAIGLALSIYIHEMGHVAMLRQLGIAADAPLFVPGIGAFVLLKQHIDDPIVDARIGLAGPVWGLAAGIGAAVIAASTGSAVWRAIAELTGFINLFNLIPIWQLDGSRGFHALSRPQRAAAVACVVLVFALTGQKLLLIVGAVALFRTLQPNEQAGDARTFATYAGLIVALAWLARGVAN